MTPKDLVPTARVWLGYTTDTFDDELEQTIQACVLDLQNGGVVYPDLSDKLIQQAVKLYLKAFFRYDDKADRFEKSYEFLKKALELSSDYNQ